MASNLTDQVQSISEVTKAVALGDLGKLVNVDVQGEILDLKMTKAFLSTDINSGSSRGTATANSRPVRERKNIYFCCFFVFILSYRKYGRTSVISPVPYRLSM